MTSRWVHTSKVTQQGKVGEKEFGYWGNAQPPEATQARKYERIDFFIVERKHLFRRWKSALSSIKPEK